MANGFISFNSLLLFSSSCSTLTHILRPCSPASCPPCLPHGQVYYKSLPDIHTLCSFGFHPIVAITCGRPPVTSSSLAGTTWFRPLCVAFAASVSELSWSVYPGGVRGGWRGLEGGYKLSGWRFFRQTAPFVWVGHVLPS